MKLTAEYSLEKDLWNYTRYLYDTGYSYGVEDKNSKIIGRLPIELQNIFNSPDSDDVKSKQLLTYLTKQNELKKDDFEKIINSVETMWTQVGNQIIYFLENLFDKRNPFEIITTYLTSNSIYPYNFEKRYFYISTKNIPTGSQMDIIIHELGHFMFLYYYPELKDKLGQNKYQLLKESLSFFTNPSQMGYPDEKPLRDLYISKKWNNLDEAIQEAVNFLTNQ